MEDTTKIRRIESGNVSLNLVNVILTDEQLDWLKGAAEREGVSLGQFITQAALAKGHWKTDVV